MRSFEAARDADGAGSSVDFPEDDVERAKHGRNVGEHVAAAHEVHRLKMRIARSADFAAVGLVGAVGDEKDAELALWRFDGGINFAGRHVIALGVKLEVMDQRL